MIFYQLGPRIKPVPGAKGLVPGDQANSCVTPLSPLWLLQFGVHMDFDTSKSNVQMTGQEKLGVRYKVSSGEGGGLECYACREFARNLHELGTLT